MQKIYGTENWPSEKSLFSEKLWRFNKTQCNFVTLNVIEHGNDSHDPKETTVMEISDMLSLNMLKYKISSVKYLSNTQLL